MKIRLYQIMRSFRDTVDNLLYCDVGDRASQKVDISDVVSGFSAFGLVGMPAESDDDVTECLVYEDAGGAFALGFRSPKLLDLLGKLIPGEVCIYNSYWCRVYLKKNGVSIAVLDKDKSPVCLTVSPEGFSAKAQFGSAVYDKDGLRVIDQSGGSIMMGGIGGVNPKVSSYIRFTADKITLNGAVQLGASPSATYLPVAYAISPLLTGAAIPTTPAAPIVGISSVYVAIGV